MKNNPLRKGIALTIIIFLLEKRYRHNYRTASLDFLKGEKILNVEKNLVSLTLTFSKDFLYTPGVIFNVVRNIAWENINIFEIVSTNTELTFIIHKKDAMKGYKVLEKLIEENK